MSHPPLLLLAALLLGCPSDDKDTAPADTADSGSGRPEDHDRDGYDTITDCDDRDPLVNPGEVEICDFQDNDCDGTVDEDVTSTYYQDADLDGYGDANTTMEACQAQAGWVQNPNDCNDAEPDAYKGHPEYCTDGIDNDCDGATDADDPDC